ncbi:putative pseudouridine synthase, catalytic domain-containing protein [Rosa chinensis]|uniref:Putative pseudouridine synthase, catalytic domain-containing protein n=1 Tax=Rosa chinensis TaxID=74649 RepID=A0A2P6RPR6_ROSCH|nr:putative pseudouridine synthase, catalytic domain-containing protein [Rosa chinensis]
MNICFGNLRHCFVGLQITVDGEVIRDLNMILRVGSQLVYHKLPWREPDAPYLLEVLYEDDDMQRTVLTQLLWRQTQKIHHLACQKSHLVPVHRLGRGTSGILLGAKINHAKKQLAAYFADGTSHIGDDRKISKIYRALGTGILCEEEVMLSHETLKFVSDYVFMCNLNVGISKTISVPCFYSFFDLESCILGF